MRMPVGLIAYVYWMVFAGIGVVCCIAGYMYWMVFTGTVVACCIAEYLFVREVVRTYRDKSCRLVLRVLAVAVAFVDCIRGVGCLAFALSFYMKFGGDTAPLEIIVFCMAISPALGVFLWLVSSLAPLLLIDSPPLGLFLPIILPMAAVSCCAQVVRFKVMRLSPGYGWWKTLFVFHVTYWPEVIVFPILAMQ